MLSKDIIALVVTWTIIVTIAVFLRKVLGRGSVEVYYGLALIVRGREVVNRVLERAAKPLSKIPSSALSIALIIIFGLTMLFFIPIPLVMIPSIPRSICFLDHMMMSGTVLLLRNLVLGISYITSRITSIGLIQHGFLTLQPLIPGLTISFKTFMLILVAIGISVLVHEIAHGAVAKKFKIPAKSGGFFTSFLILFGGFVELEENELRQRGVEARLAVYSAGVVANVLLGVLIALLYILLAQITNVVGSPLGLVVTHSDIHGIHTGDIIVKVDDHYVHNIFELINILPNIILQRPYVLKLLVNHEGTLREVYINVSKEGIQGLLNVKVSLSELSLLGGKLVVTNTLVYNILLWLLVLNLTLAMLNALPAYPLDGGLVVQTILEELLDQKKAQIVTYILSVVFWLLLALSIILTFEAHLYVFVS